MVHDISCEPFSFEGVCLPIANCQLPIAHFPVYSMPQKE